MADKEKGSPLVADRISDDDRQKINKTIVQEVRTKMSDFWKGHSHNANEEEMMLDTNADTLGKLEIPEILSMLPNIKGKDVLELGAGIGRFTGHLARRVKSVVAIDFMENFVHRNEADNGHLKNIKFLQADVTYLEYPPNSFDVVFSNWLLMYLEQSEVESLFARIFDWLRPGGFLFFRESCFHQSGDKSRESNPSQYRKPSTYNEILRVVSLESDEFSLKLIMSKSIQSYIKMKNNRNQICWLVQKVAKSNLKGKRECRMFEEYFDDSFSSVESIVAVEGYLGGHVMSGEVEVYKKIFCFLRPESATHVLNIGCGLGWMASRLVQDYDVTVHGIDPSSNMVALAQERANLYKQNNVQFQMEWLEHLILPSNEFDSVLFCSSVDVEDHLGLFGKVKDSMKTGGWLVVVDFCLKDGDLKSTLCSHIKKFNYHLLTPSGYRQVLSDIGFELVHEEDLTSVQLETLNRDILKVKDCGSLAQMLKDSMAKKILWMGDGQLKLHCFVCQLK